MFEEKSMPASQWKSWTVRKADTAGPKPSTSTATKPPAQVVATGTTPKGQSSSKFGQSQMPTRDCFKQAHYAVNVLRGFLNRTASELDIDLKQVLAGASAPQAARGHDGSAVGTSSSSARTPTAHAGKASGATPNEQTLEHLRQEAAMLRQQLKEANNKLNVAEAKLSRHDLATKLKPQQKPPAGQ